MRPCNLEDHCDCFDFAQPELAALREVEKAASCVMETWAREDYQESEFEALGSALRQLDVIRAKVKP